MNVGLRTDSGVFASIVTLGFFKLCARKHRFLRKKKTVPQAISLGKYYAKQSFFPLGIVIL